MHPAPLTLQKHWTITSAYCSGYLLQHRQSQLFLFPKRLCRHAESTVSDIGIRSRCSINRSAWQEELKELASTISAQASHNLPLVSHYLAPITIASYSHHIPAKACFHAVQEEGGPGEEILDEPERALLVGVGLQHSGRSDDNRDVYSSDESLEELSSLAQSAGLQVCCATQPSGTHAKAAQSKRPEQKSISSWFLTISLLCTCLRWWASFSSIWIIQILRPSLARAKSTSCWSALPRQKQVRLYFTS